MILSLSFSRLGLHLFQLSVESVTAVFISAAAAAPQPTGPEVRLDMECHLVHIKRWQAK